VAKLRDCSTTGWARMPMTATTTSHSRAPKPRPPVLLSTITVAYDITLDRRLNVKLGRQVGTLALGTLCVDPMPTNKGVYFTVDAGAVTFTRTPRSSVVVTRCELV
jgi:hypothetical protein